MNNVNYLAYQGICTQPYYLTIKGTGACWKFIATFKAKSIIYQILSFWMIKCCFPNIILIFVAFLGCICKGLLCNVGLILQHCLQTHQCSIILHSANVAYYPANTGLLAIFAINFYPIDSSTFNYYVLYLWNRVCPLK